MKFNSPCTRTRIAYGPLIRFVFASLFVLTLSRVILTLLYWERVGSFSLFPLFIGGLRIDLCLISMFAVLPAVLVSFFCQSERWRRWEKNYYQVSLLLIVFLEMITPTFIFQYDTRPNRLFFEYLQHPKEVTEMLFKGFGNVILFVFLGMAITFVLIRKTIVTYPTTKLLIKTKITGAIVCAVVGFAFIRGTIAHRPINPATVAFASDRMLNTLPLNSAYSLLYSLYRMKDEKNAGALYGKMNEATMHKIVRQSAIISDPPFDENRPSLHMTTASTKHDIPPHVVIILEESLGARYVGHLTGASLTPELDNLSKEAWTLKNLYATGTRSARGIEAVISGFLPTPARSVVKLGLSQNNFFTLANLFNAHNYNTSFMYGGEAHFDNMRSFLLNNGFKHIIDRPKFKNPVFTGSWGVSDEDMLNRVHEELESATEPQFIFAFSVTNHTPYEYPEGRITPNPPKAATVGNAVRYADWALGDFFKKAKVSDYYKNTIFLIVTDHDSRVYGASLIPIEHFHIPGMFLGGGIAAKSDERLVSQIDLAPTLVSLAGISDIHPMLGYDLTKLPDSSPGRAIMQYGDNFGYREGNNLIVLQPRLSPTQYNVSENKLNQADVDESLKTKALAHALWPSWAYRNRRYSPYL